MRACVRQLRSLTRLFVDRRKKELRGRVKSAGEPSGEHVRSFRDSCLEFATKRAMACRKRGKKKFACRRAMPRVLDTPCHPLNGLFLPFAPSNAVYLLRERTRQRYTASDKKKGMSMKGIENWGKRKRKRKEEKEKRR